MRYLCRRLAYGALLLLGVSLLSFLFAELAPGDPFDELRLDPRTSSATLAAMRDRYGIDRPVGEKYLYWLRSVARGELGFSVTHNTAVGPLLWRRVVNTLMLTVPATALAWLIAIPIGIWAAARQGRLADRVAGVATTVFLSIPDVLLGLLFLLIAVKTGAFPTGGMVSHDFETMNALSRVADIASHLVLPLSALTLVILPTLIRHVRASVIDVLHAPFIQAARGLGVPERRILFRGALRAAANPLISLFGLSVAGLLSTSLVIESILSWPGLGPLLLDAVAARDLHLVVGAVTCSTLLLILGSLFADGLLVMADPRIRPEPE